LVSWVCKTGVFWGWFGLGVTYVLTLLRFWNSVRTVLNNPKKRNLLQIVRILGSWWFRAVFGGRMGVWAALRLARYAFGAKLRGKKANVTENVTRHRHINQRLRSEKVAKLQCYVF